MIRFVILGTGLVTFNLFGYMESYYMQKVNLLGGRGYSAPQ